MINLCSGQNEVVLKANFCSLEFCPRKLEGNFFLFFA